MLATGRRCSSFSLTKSGRIKSCALNCVWRMRFRRGGERRKRRGRCTNFLTGRGYLVGGSVASSRRDESLRPTAADLTGGAVPCSPCMQPRIRPGLSLQQMTDYLLVDISNSYTKLAFASIARLSVPVRIRTTELSSGVVSGFLKRQEVRKIVVSSVVPKKNPAILKAAKKVEVLWLDSTLKLGLGIDYPKPKSIGADRLANAVAVTELYG